MTSFSPPLTSASSPRLAPSSSSSSSTSRAAPPTISLPLNPGASLGPFVLGSTVYTTLRYLRHSSRNHGKGQGHAQQAHGPTLFPRVTFDFEAQDPRDGLVVVRPDRRISCVFEAGRMKVVVLSLSDDSSEEDTGAPSGLSGEREEAAYRRRVELLWNGKVLHVDGGEEARRSNPTSAMLSRGDIQQLFGPTYPARRYTSTDGLHDYLPLSGTKTSASASSSRLALHPAVKKERWALSYDGFSFLFDAEGQDRSELSKIARPIALVLHVGEDPLNPGEVPWPRVEQSSAHQGGLKRNSEARPISLEGQVTDTAQCDGVWKDANIASAGTIIEQAIIRPHRGLTLHLIRPPNDASAASSPTRSRLQLRLHETSQQDVLLDLGAPERKWVKGEKGSVDGFSVEESAEEVDFGISPAPPIFYSYPSLGLDLLFAPLPPEQGESEEEDESHLPLLRRIVVHSDVPGSATWGRFEHVNWKVEVPAAEGGVSGTSVKNSNDAASKPTPASASVNGTLKKKTAPKSSAASSAGKASGTSTPVPPSSEEEGQGTREVKVEYLDWRTDLPTLYSRLSSLQPSPSSTSTTREVLDLDRSTSSEFRSLLTLDVRTTLRGFPGLVGEVLPLPVGAGAGAGADEKRKVDVQGRKGGEAEEEKGVVVAWTIC